MYRWAEPREYVFSDSDYKHWLSRAPEPLSSASVLARRSGICRGEMIALQKDSVTLHEKADGDGFWGEIDVRRGLKQHCRRRILKVNKEMWDVLKELLSKSNCKHVFTSPDDATRPLTPHTLGSQARRMKAKGGFTKEALTRAPAHSPNRNGRTHRCFHFAANCWAQRHKDHNALRASTRAGGGSAFKRLHGGKSASGVHGALALTLDETQVAQLLRGEVISLSIPAGTTELRLNSTQEPTHQPSLPFGNVLSQ